MTEIALKVINPILIMALLLCLSVFGILWHSLDKVAKKAQSNTIRLHNVQDKQEGYR